MCKGWVRHLVADSASAYGASFEQVLDFEKHHALSNVLHARWEIAWRLTVEHGLSQRGVALIFNITQGGVHKWCSRAKSSDVVPRYLARKIVQEVARNENVEFEDVMFGPWDEAEMVALRKLALIRIYEETDFDMAQAASFMGYANRKAVFRARLARDTGRC